MFIINFHQPKRGEAYDNAKSRFCHEVQSRSRTTMVLEMAFFEVFIDHVRQRAVMQGGWLPEGFDYPSRSALKAIKKYTSITGAYENTQ